MKKEFYASFIYQGHDYTPSEPRPDGMGYQSTRIRVDNAKEAAAIAKRDFLAEHAAHVAKRKSFISPTGCHTIVMFEYQGDTRLGIHQFAWHAV